MSVAIDGKPEEIAGVTTRSFLDAGGPKHCKNFYPRGHRLFGELRQVVMHTTKGKRRCGAVALDAAGKPLVASRDTVGNFAIYYARANCRDASAHLWVGETGLVLCTVDLASERAWHASSCNPYSIGIEIVEREDGTVYAESLRVAALLVAWLCDRFDIPKRIPMRDGKHITGDMPKAHEFRGVVGHRNETDKHDPGDGIFDALLASGFVGVDPDAATAPTIAPPATVEPAPALPSWLSAAHIVPLPAPLSRKLAADPAHRRAFVAACDADLRALGVPQWQRHELTAIAATETGWGTSALYQLNNCVGLKIKKDVADWHVATLGRPMSWAPAPGHVASGDDAIEAYVAFATRVDCWRVSLARMFGTPGDKTTKSAAPWRDGNREAARLLWAGDERWFRSLLVTAKYRDEKTAASPDKSIAAHRAIVADVRRLAT